MWGGACVIEADRIGASGKSHGMSGFPIAWSVRAPRPRQKCDPIGFPHGVRGGGLRVWPGRLLLSRVRVKPRRCVDAPPGVSCTCGHDQAARQKGRREGKWRAGPAGRSEVTTGRPAPW